MFSPFFVSLVFFQHFSLVSIITVFFVHFFLSSFCSSLFAFLSFFFSLFSPFFLYFSISVFLLLFFSLSHVSFFFSIAVFVNLLFVLPHFSSVSFVLDLIFLFILILYLFFFFSSSAYFFARKKSKISVVNFSRWNCVFVFWTLPSSVFHLLFFPSLRRPHSLFVPFFTDSWCLLSLLLVFSFPTFFSFFSLPCFSFVVSSPFVCLSLCLFTLSLLCCLCLFLFFWKITFIYLSIFFQNLLFHLFIPFL